MRASILSTATVLFGLALAGCNGSIDDLNPKAEKPLPPKVVAMLKAKGMTRTSPIMVRIFKEEGKLEVWKQKDTGRYDLAAAYDICKWSGKLGPKFTEGDRQAPEGFYTVRPAQMNPKSSYHLAFNIGFPNAYDRAHGRSGQHLMVHGACSSSGCYSMSDEQVEQIYAFARDAFRGGQTDFQIQAFPFRMTAENMVRYKGDPNYPFWTMLKEGYDHFEITKVPPKVDVCGKRYVFNRMAEGGQTFSPTAPCPATIQPGSLQSAYQTYNSSYEAAFASAINRSKPKERKPSIAGLDEAKLVADWSKRRARGERVSREPPSLAAPQTMIAAAPAASPAEAARPEAGPAEATATAALPATAPVPAAVAAAPAPATTPAPAAEDTATAAAAPADPISTADAAPAATTTEAPAAAATAIVPAAETRTEQTPLRKKLLSLFGS